MNPFFIARFRFVGHGTLKLHFAQLPSLYYSERRLGNFFLVEDLGYSLVSSNECSIYGVKSMVLFGVAAFLQNEQAV